MTASMGLPSHTGSEVIRQCAEPLSAGGEPAPISELAQMLAIWQRVVAEARRQHPTLSTEEVERIARRAVRIVWS